jgi:hypothetical protein
MFGALAVIAFASAAFFTVRAEKRIAERRAAFRSFDLHAREATDALADIRAGQQAYVAAGQGIAFWMPKVAATTSAVVLSLNDLRGLAASPAGKTAIDEAAATVDEFGNVDKRARDYLKSGQPLMAGDVVFTEGGQTAATAARQVENARLAEHQALDADEAGVRRLQAYSLAGSAAVALLVIVVLLPAGAAAGTIESAAESTASPARAGISGDLSLRPQSTADDFAPFPSARAVSPILRSAAELCTDFGRATSAADLTTLLGRAADMMDASGMVAWLGDTNGGDLRPALAHGYSAQMLARMPAVPRSSNNAAAAAYRTGTLQIVLARPGGSSGAIVAPLLSADGCIGALSAEIQHGGEASESVQALATIFAAQLAGVVSAAPQGGQQRAAASS